MRALIEAVLSRWGRLDVLVNNAGIYYQADAVDTPERAWNNVLAVNLTGAFLCIKYAVPAMAKGGAIVNVASEAGLVGIRNQVAYNVSKGGLISLTKSCAVDFAAQPDTRELRLPGHDGHAAGHRRRLRARPIRQRRTARPGTGPAAQIAWANRRKSRPRSSILAGDSARYATGAVLSIDGGYTAQ